MSATQKKVIAIPRPPVRVLYIIDQLCQLGGAERILLEVVKRLSPERFTSSVVTFKLDQSLEALKGLSSPVRVFPLNRTYDLKAAAIAMRLGRFIRQEKVSLVHTFFETSDLWAAPIASVSGDPVLVSSRRDMGILRTRKHQLAYPFVNRMFDRVLAVSDEVRSYCLQHDRLAPDRVETLYNGVDLVELEAKTREYDARQLLGLLPDTPIVVTLANIRSVKGIDVLIRAAQRVCEEFSGATFVIVGSVLEPDTMNALRSQAEALQIAKNIHFVGAMANPYPVLQASNVFCLPSRSEGFSNALLEAMGCSLPCVATRVGGNGEALTHDKNGYLVASEDDSDMAQSILRILRDPVLAQRLGRSARETVETRFSMEAMMNRLMNIYDELLVARHV